MTSGEFIPLLLRLLGYIALTLLCLFVIPTYHHSFRLAWRAMGVFFVVTLGTVIFRLWGGNALSLVYNDWVITPTLLLVLLAVFRNLQIVGRWREMKQ